MTGEPAYVRLEPNGTLPDIGQFSPFKAVIVSETESEDEWRDLVSRWLIDSGCLYMMAWGPDCQNWHFSVDEAQILKFLPGELPDEHHVMTTGHEDETLESVFWYAQFCANFSYLDVELDRLVIIHIGSTDRKAEFLALYEQSHDLAERDADELEPVKPDNWFKKLFRF